MVVVAAVAVVGGGGGPHCCGGGRRRPGGFLAVDAALLLRAQLLDQETGKEGEEEAATVPGRNKRKGGGQEGAATKKGRGSGKARGKGGAERKTTKPKAVAKAKLLLAQLRKMQGNKGKKDDGAGEPESQDSVDKKNMCNNGGDLSELYDFSAQSCPDRQ